MGEIELAAEISIPAQCKGLVLCVDALSSNNPRLRTAIDELHRAGLGSILVDLLTEEESADDAVVETYRFDLPLVEWTYRGDQ